MRAAVTGGQGFIGQHLIRALLARGHDLVVIDRRPAAVEDGSQPGATSWALDVRDTASLTHALAGVDVVFHHAAVIARPGSEASPEAVMSINIGGTISVMKAARAAGVRRVVFASSAAVYGQSAVTPSRETTRIAPRSPYALSKFIAEGSLADLGEGLGVETIALRYFNVFGPGQPADQPNAAVVPAWVRAALDGRPATLFGEAATTRDFVYIDDVVAATLLAAERPLPRRAIVNVGSGQETTLGELLRQVARATGREMSLLAKPARGLEIHRSRADISTAATVLGWRPEVPLFQGLLRTASWHLKAKLRPARARPTAPMT